MNKKLTTAQKRVRKAAKKARQQAFVSVFINGKQVRIEREPTVDGMPTHEFISENADPVWLHQNGLWELIPVENPIPDTAVTSESQADESDYEIPF